MTEPNRAVPDRDPEFQAEIDRAVTWWTRYLQSRLLPGIDAGLVARHGVEQMLANRWRVLPPPKLWRELHDQPPADPAQNDEYRKAKAKITGKDPT